MSPIDTKRRLFICFSRLGKKVTNMCFSKGGILWSFVIKICLIKRSTEVIRTQWQNFLQDPRTPRKTFIGPLLRNYIKLNYSMFFCCCFFFFFFFFVIVVVFCFLGFFCLLFFILPKISTPHCLTQLFMLNLDNQQKPFLKTRWSLKGMNAPSTASLAYYGKIFK